MQGLSPLPRRLRVICPVLGAVALGGSEEPSLAFSLFPVGDYYI